MFDVPNIVRIAKLGLVYDVFHCRGDYIGMVAPYYCRPAFDGITITVDDDSAEWFALPDSRQFTLSVLIKIPMLRRFQPRWLVRVGEGQCNVKASRIRRRRVAMVAMVRYDAEYLAEWIEHHHGLGFEHFYIYNHEDERDISDVCRNFGYLVTEIPWFGPYSRESAWREPFLPPTSHCYTQCPQMMHAALKYGHLWDWMGFFDADEFLCPMGPLSVKDVLDRTEQRAYGEVPFVRSAALMVQGKWFGTSGHEEIPEGGVLDNYTRCEAGHTCGTKCFVQPQTVTGSIIHYWDVEGQTARVPDNVLRFNHYRSISTYKARVGPGFDADYTNASEDRQIQKART